MRGKYSKFNHNSLDLSSTQNFELLVSSTIYHELMQIAKEIETCRASH